MTLSLQPIRSELLLAVTCCAVHEANRTSLQSTCCRVIAYQRVPSRCTTGMVHGMHTEGGDGREERGESKYFPLNTAQATSIRGEMGGPKLS